MVSEAKAKILKNKHLSLTALTPWLIFVLVSWAAINTSFRKDYKSGVMEADAKGYYAYLPAVFIYHDLNFGFFKQIEESTYYNPNLFYDYRASANDKTIDRYFVGTAIFTLPFFLIGHCITIMTSQVADGYSYYYTLLAHLGALFYFMLALIGLRKVLRSFALKEIPIAVALTAIVFGTNLFYYVVTEFGMSHLYSFTVITWFCYFFRKYTAEQNAKYLYKVAILLALIVLLRPVNLLIVLAIPFLAGNPKQFIVILKSFRTKLWTLLGAISLFILIVSIQLVIYKISCGSFIVYSYEKQGFHFLDPQVFNFLFSYRKGMFVYTPLLFISLAGFGYLFRNSRYRFFTLLGFLALLIYVFSSWFMWFYGGSFSQRVMIEFYAFFAILLATALQDITNSRIKTLYISLVVLLILVCLVQTYQYRRMQIHWSDMNKEKYWEVFMRIDKL